MIYAPFNDICFKKYFKPKSSQDFKAQGYKSFVNPHPVLS